MEAVCRGVPAPFCSAVSVRAAQASHPFGGGNAGVKMSSHAIAENLGFAARVAIDQADTKILPVEMAREYLQAGARAIMQMWRDLEEQECKVLA